MRKVTIKEHILLLRDTGVVLTLKRGVPSIITDYDFNYLDSPDAKQTINILNEMLFALYEKSKSYKDKNLIKNY